MSTRKAAALIITVLGFLLSEPLSSIQTAALAQPGGMINVFLPDLPARLTTGLGSVSGFVYDASTRSPVDGAQVCYEANCTVTDSQGEYTLANIPSGWRVLTASAFEHYSLDEALYVLGQVVNRQDISLPMLSSIGDIYLRIVLNWDPTPAWPPLNIPNDMDAHLWLDTRTPQGGVLQHIYSDIEHQGDCTTFPNACLELDVQDGYGPETIVIRLLEENGMYYYGVLNVNSSYEGVPPITQLDAAVRVYDEFGLMKEFFAPAEGQGDFWYVFSMNSLGEIQPQNCVIGLPGDNEVPLCPP